MTLRHLTIFISVYHTRSMTESAKALFMTQPSVSQAIKELEAHYNTLLFERMQHKLYPTPGAERLYNLAVKALNLFEQMEEEVSGQNGEEVLRVGANYTVGVAMISTFVNELKERNKGIKVSVNINKASVLKQLVRKNELDVLLMEQQQEEKDLIQEHFCLDHIAIVVANEHPLAKAALVKPEDIAGERFLMRERGAGTRDQFEQAMKKAGYTITPYWESISVTALIRAAKDGEGIAVLPYESVKEEISNHQLTELTLEGLSLTRHLAIIYHREKYQSEVLKQFIMLCHSMSPYPIEHK